VFFGRSRYRTKSITPDQEPDGIFIGAYLAGAVLVDIAATRFYWLRDTWTRHALVLGATGTGKTETVLRMVSGFAKALFNKLTVQVIYFDAKNDPDLPGRYGALMGMLGRETTYFPEQRIDLWRGDWRAVKRRLMRIVPYEIDGAASYYRDIARVVMEYVCVAWPEPPRSSAELFSRLDEAALQDHLQAHPLLDPIEPKLVDQVLMRYRGFWGGPGLVFDGEIAFEDIDTGYFRIDPDVLGDEADYALCMLFLDFVHYCKVRKPRERLVVLVLDEFSAIANAFEMDRMAEELRSFNVSLIFVPQSIEGMGSENQRWRLFKAARLKVVHRYEDPLPLVEVVGRKRVPEFSLALDDETERGDRLSWVERWKVPPEWILNLEDGEAVAIREGSGTKVKVAMAPEVDPVDVPEPESIDRVYDWKRLPIGGSSKEASSDPSSEASSDDPSSSGSDVGDEESGGPPSFVFGKEG
jgi:Cdc6-like AAA superfamily ATPase